VVWRLQTYYKQNKKSLFREMRFWSLLCLWVVAFVASNRTSWKDAAETNQLQSFASATEKSLDDFVKRSAFWATTSLRLSGFTDSMTPAELKSHIASWSSLLESHDEWLSTYIVTRRHGFEAGVAATLVSSQVVKLFAEDKESPIAWRNETQAAALQLISGVKENQNRNLAFVRSLKKGSQWIQFAVKSQSSKPGWSTWVVHTFSEKMFPNLQAENPLAEVALFNPETKKFLFSKGFSALKIESSELQAFIQMRKTIQGAEESKFALSKKEVWLSWTKSSSNQWILLQALPNSKIPVPQFENAPSFLKEWSMTLAWLVTSCLLLYWTFMEKMWCLRVQKSSAEIAAESNDIETYKPDQSSLDQTNLRKHEAEREFCRHLLSDIGSTGRIQLAGKATANVEVRSSTLYKGSWWLLENIDSSRVLAAIGDASGQGLAAGTAAYSVKYVLGRALKEASELNDNELLLKKLYSLAALSAEGVLLGSTHCSAFLAIIDLDLQKMVFINAGYPGPMLKLGARKNIVLTPHSDPMGLGSDSIPLPRWVNLNPGCELVICNIGSRNTDLTELDESELIKIFIHPFGQSQRTVSEEIEEDAA